MIADRAGVGHLHPDSPRLRPTHHAGGGARGSRQGQHEPRSNRMPHILLVEDHRIVAQAVRETLEEAGWRVSLCGDGAVAVGKLASEAVYSLLLFDNHLPNVNGLELARYARGLTHRKGTPIIMFSASECERDARLAGANEFLRKPADTGKIVETVARLLISRSNFKLSR